MIKTIFSILLKAAFLSLLLFMVYLFYPRDYDVLAYEPLDETAYWNLSTGSTIGYVKIDPKEGKKDTPIIYLHGGPGGVISKKIIDMLRPFADNGYEVYAYDQIGSGSSGKLEDISEYSVERHTADLAAIIEQVNRDKVILLGQSWGSVLATLYASDYKERVGKIIMTGPGPIFPINQKLKDLESPDSLNLKPPVFSNSYGNRLVYTFREKCMRKYASLFGRRLLSDAQVDDFFTHLNTALNRSALYDTSMVSKSPGGGSYYAHIMTMKSLYSIEDQRDKIRELDIPILILKGQYDNQKWGYTEEYLRLFWNSELQVIPNAGHFIHEEQAELYYKYILSFMKEE